jgi:hypothetical protein
MRLKSGGKLYRVLAIAMTIGLLSSALLAVSAMANGTASSPTSDRGVVPYISDVADNGGNVSCDQLGEFDYSSGRINYNDGTFDGDFPDGIDVTVTDGTYVSWSAPAGVKIMKVIVKGGNDANIYAYDGTYMYDSGLASPPNNSGNPAGLSNLTFCYDMEEDPGEWCSPGYWRQAHHLDSWDATVYSPDDLFYDALGYYPTLSKKGVTDGATTNPTLLQVLESPQWYGGDDFNAVGDLLSAAHPDVNFLGERVEDSCPLN